MRLVAINSGHNKQEENVIEFLFHSSMAWDKLHKLFHALTVDYAMLSKMSICTFEIPGIFVLVLTVPTSLAA
jgi:hypothetical protein